MKALSPSECRKRDAYRGGERGEGQGEIGVRGARCEIRTSVGATLAKESAAANGAGQRGSSGATKFAVPPPILRNIWRKSSAVKQCLAATDRCVLYK